MTKLITKIIVFAVFLSLVFGCSWMENMRSSNANVEDKTRDTLGLKKTGIAECDEVVDLLAKKYKGNTNTQDESWTDKAVTEVIKQQIYNYINDGKANKTPQEKADLQDKCKVALGYLRDGQKK